MSDIQYNLNDKVRLVDLAKYPKKIIESYIETKPVWMQKGLQHFLLSNTLN